MELKTIIDKAVLIDGLEKQIQEFIKLKINCNQTEITAKVGQLAIRLTDAERNGIIDDRVQTMQQQADVYKQEILLCIK